MKARLAFIFALFVSAFSIAAFAAAPPLEFTGILTTGDASNARFSLRDASGHSSEWLKLGAIFEGYTLTSFDAKEETLVLMKDGATTRLKLVDSKPSTAVATSAEAPPEIARPILNNLRQLAAAADQYYLENGVSSTTLAELVGETRYVRRLIPVAGEDYGVLQFTQGSQLFSVQTSQGYTVALDLAELRPREHIIQAGETLSSIARRYGMTPKDLGVLNQISNPARIQVGQKIRLK